MKSAPHDLAEPVVKRQERILQERFQGRVSLAAQVAIDGVLYFRTLFDRFLRVVMASGVGRNSRASDRELAPVVFGMRKGREKQQFGVRMATTVRGDLEIVHEQGIVICGYRNHAELAFGARKCFAIEWIEIAVRYGNHADQVRALFQAEHVVAQGEALAQRFGIHLERWNKRLPFQRDDSLDIGFGQFDGAP